MLCEKKTYLLIHINSLTVFLDNFTSHGINQRSQTRGLNLHKKHKLQFYFLPSLVAHVGLFSPYVTRELFFVKMWTSSNFWFENSGINKATQKL